jgi:hypothetical protein
MVFGHTEHDEEPRAIPIGRAELPKSAADRHDPGGGHVDGAEAAMGGVVRRAELLRPESGQRLRLVAPSEKGNFPRIARADLAEPSRGGFQRLVPGNLAELARTARTGPQERRAQPCRRVVLHDAGGTLGAEHAAIDRMVAIAFDVANLAVLQMDVDTAATGAHVACGLSHLVGDRLR